ncbi:hypothetical protein BH24GEM2_BH24GEM2_00550 [soil metagenome]|jgi:hypothetical protein
MTFTPKLIAVVLRTPELTRKLSECTLLCSVLGHGTRRKEALGTQLDRGTRQIRSRLFLGVNQRLVCTAVLALWMLTGRDRGGRARRPASRLPGGCPYSLHS